jgi:hypothetical protein
MSLYGAGVLQARIFFHVYAVALYLGEGVPPHQVLKDVPKRLEIAYLYKIPARLMAETANANLAGRLSTNQFAVLQPRINQLHAAYRDVVPGDRYALTYLPEKGTVLSLNGKEQCRIPGNDFAEAYFGVWLDEKAAAPSLRKKLLTKWTP